jgi:fructose-6-phosphate aldolase 2
MIILLDTANINDISNLIDIFPVDGVTTNPTIVAREKADFLSLIKQIRNAIGEEKMLHVQTLSTSFEGIIKEAHLLLDELEGNVYIKIPVIEEGIKAIRKLSSEGVRTTATAVFTPQQALIAAKSGADFIAPYVNRLDNISANGPSVVADIVRLFNTYGLQTKVLGASFKNVEQVHRVSMAGCHGVTVSPDILRQMLSHPLTAESVATFSRDWQNCYGKTDI